MLLEPRPLDAPVRAPSHTASRVVLGCLVVAALTLLLPSTPTYDPWAWIIWGREIAHLDLVTTDGPSWKPLPALFTTPFSLFGGAAPWLWLIVARAGGLLGLVFAFRVARRLGGTIAGLTAVSALALAPWLLKNAALGNSEGLMAACVLGAVDRHLSRAPRQAFAFALAAALLRPEAWPFFGLYGLWLGWRHRAALPLVAAGFLSLPVLWFGPELWGSGDLNRASERAQKPLANSAAFADHPAVEVVRNAAGMVTWPVLAGLLVAAVVLVRRDRSNAHDRRMVAVLAAMAVVWLGIVAVMTSHGFSGNQRYLVMPVTLIVIAGAVGVGWLAGAVRALRGRTLAGAGVLVALAFTAPYWGGLGSMFSNLAYQGHLHADLGRAVAAAGGPERLRACGPATTGAFLVPDVAWSLGVHANQVTLEPARPGVVFRVSTVPGSNPVPSLSTLGPGPLRTLATSGHWRLVGDCA